MKYDYNKIFGRFKFQSGYRKFYMNSLKGYGWKVINVQTVYMTEVHKLKTKFCTDTDKNSLTDLCNITIPVLNMAWKKSYKPINKSTNDSKASVSEGRAVIVLHDALHTHHIRLFNVLHRQDTAIGVHCELWLHRICEVGPIVWKKRLNVILLIQRKLPLFPRSWEINSPFHFFNLLLFLIMFFKHLLKWQNFDYIYLVIVFWLLFAFLAHDLL